MKSNLLYMVILAVIYQKCIELDASFYHCEFLIEPGPPLELLCSGYYSLELKLRYGDNLVEIDVPYRIWARSYSISPRQILISFYESPITHCNNVTFHHNWMHCDKSDMFGIIVHPEEIHCFRYTFAYVKDLQRNCNALVDSKADYVAIHYASSFHLQVNSSSKANQSMTLRIIVLICCLKRL